MYRSAAFHASMISLKERTPTAAVFEERTRRDLAEAQKTLGEMQQKVRVRSVVPDCAASSYRCATCARVISKLHSLNLASL